MCNHHCTWPCTQTQSARMSLIVARRETSWRNETDVRPARMTETETASRGDEASLWTRLHRAASSAVNRPRSARCGGGKDQFLAIPSRIPETRARRSALYSRGTNPWLGVCAALCLHCVLSVYFSSVCVSTSGLRMCWSEKLVVVWLEDNLSGTAYRESRPVVRRSFNMPFCNGLVEFSVNNTFVCIKRT